MTERDILVCSVEKRGKASDKTPTSGVLKSQEWTPVWQPTAQSKHLCCLKLRSSPLRSSGTIGGECRYRSRQGVEFCPGWLWAAVPKSSYPHLNLLKDTNLAHLIVMHDLSRNSCGVRTRWAWNSSGKASYWAQSYRLSEQCQLPAKLTAHSLLQGTLGSASQRVLSGESPEPPLPKADSRPTRS